MKSSIILTLFICLSFSSFSQEQLPDTVMMSRADAKLMMKDSLSTPKWLKQIDYFILKSKALDHDLEYLKFRVTNKSEMSGIVIGYNKNKKLDSEYPFNNGKINGIVKIYYRKGKIYQETPYVNGKIDGVVKWYFENDSIWRKIPYTQGKIDGTMVYYYPNGIVETTSPMVKGSEKGIEKDYDRSGKLEKEALYNSNVLFTKYYVENGNEAALQPADDKSISSSIAKDTTILTDDSLKNLRVLCVGVSFHNLFADEKAHVFNSYKEIGNYYKCPIDTTIDFSKYTLLHYPDFITDRDYKIIRVTKHVDNKMIYCIYVLTPPANVGTGLVGLGVSTDILIPKLCKDCKVVFVHEEMCETDYYKKDK